MHFFCLYFCSVHVHESWYNVHIKIRVCQVIGRAAAGSAGPVPTPVWLFVSESFECVPFTQWWQFLSSRSSAVLQSVSQNFVLFSVERKYYYVIVLIELVINSYYCCYGSSLLLLLLMLRPSECMACLTVVHVIGEIERGAIQQHSLLVVLPPETHLYDHVPPTRTKSRIWPWLYRSDWSY